MDLGAYDFLGLSQLPHVALSLVAPRSFLQFRLLGRTVQENNYNGSYPMDHHWRLPSMLYILMDLLTSEIPLMQFCDYLLSPIGFLEVINHWAHKRKQPIGQFAFTHLGISSGTCSRLRIRRVQV